MVAEPVLQRPGYQFDREDWKSAKYTQLNQKKKEQNIIKQSFLVVRNKLVKYLNEKDFLLLQVKP